MIHNEKIKILMFIDGLRGGGKERQLVQLVKGLSSKNNINCEIAVMNEDIHYREIYDLDIKIHFLIRKTKIDPTILYKLYKICKEFKPDIIHTWDTMTSLYVTPIAKLLNIKLVIGSIRMAPDHINAFSLSWLISLITFPFADKIVSNSYAGLRSYKVKKNGVCIHNGFDLSRIKNIEDKNIVRQKFGLSSEKIVGIVANFTDLKDYTTYFLAAKKVLDNRKDVSFIAIGGGVYLEKFKFIANNHDNIKLVGIQNHVESIINTFNVGVLSTYTEGISNSIMEYMALGKPVIATDGGGTKELVINGKTGFLVQPKSIDEMADRIDYLLNNQEIAKEMGAEGKKRIETEFSLEKMIRAYFQLYKDILKS